MKSSAKLPLDLIPARPPRDSGALALNMEGLRLLTVGRYSDARDLFVWAARLAEATGDTRSAAMNRNNAGAAELVTLQYADALKEFNEALRIAEASRQMMPLLYSMNNLANLYVLIGQPGNALRVAREALNGPAGQLDNHLHAVLLCQVTIALAKLNRFDEARPIQAEAVSLLTRLKKLDDVSRFLAVWADDNLRAGHLDEAERVLLEGMELIRARKVTATAGILLGMANLEGRKAHPEPAEKLYQDALRVREDRTPRWKILADRGRFRLESRQDEKALADFREAGRLITRIRADMVPADQDRVAFETGIGQYLRGLVEAGNRIAVRTGSAAITAETLDAAEQNRLWSLRSLLPAVGDWRSRLPASYWEKLTRYQTLQRKELASASALPNPMSAPLMLELQQMEAAAGGQSSSVRPAAAQSPIRHAQALLGPDTVLFSFHLSSDSSWMWAVTHNSARVFRLPPEDQLTKSANDFVRGGMKADAGKKLYAELFGTVPAEFVQHSRWLLEPDGSLHDVPFAALVTGEKLGTPVYLVERVSLQSIPGVLLLEKRPFRSSGDFVGIADPVYNAADGRFQGEHRRPDFSLPRLPRTAQEVEVSARAWPAGQVHLLTGMNASADHLWKMSAKNPSVLHFATHVVTGTGAYRSGLIALSLNARSAMDLLGPQEILARTVSADLVVLNGCHSAQGETVPSAGRMGLTRAWIGAGAGGVLATQWDISDDDAESMMSSFYAALRSDPALGVAGALRRSQLAVIHSPHRDLTRWAGYYLLSRAL